MRYRDKQTGAPLTLFKATKSQLSAMTPEVGSVAFATDTSELGLYTSTGWIWSSLTGGSGSGDMLKSVYDVNNDGVVDWAAAVNWGNIQGIPTEFPPSEHDHNDLYYTMGQLNTSGAGGEVHWDNIISKPAFGGSTNFVATPYLFTDCLYANAAALNPFYGAAISSGTINAPTTTYINSSVIGAVRLRSSTTANGGYMISSSTGVMIPTNGMVVEGRFNFQNFSTTTFRFGIHNSTTSSAPTNGVYFQYSASSTIDGRITVSSSTTTTPSTYTLTNNTWYKLRIEIGSTTTTFRIYDNAGNQVWTSSITASLPDTQLAYALVTTESSTTATDMCHVDYLLLTTNSAIAR